MVTMIEINFFLKKEERNGTGFNFPAFKRDGSGFDFPVRPCMAISLLVAGQSAASISWKPSRDMGERPFPIHTNSASSRGERTDKTKQKNLVMSTAPCYISRNSHREDTCSCEKMRFETEQREIFRGKISNASNVHIVQMTEISGWVR